MPAADRHARWPVGLYTFQDGEYDIQIWLARDLPEASAGCASSFRTICWC
jgi:hypothetical protein